MWGGGGGCTYFDRFPNQSYRAHTRYFLLNTAQKRFANQSYRAHTRDFLLENMAQKK